jgi:hypothetical protein
VDHVDSLLAHTVCLTDSNNIITYCLQHVISSVFVSIIHFHKYFLVFTSTPLISITKSRTRKHQEILAVVYYINIPTEDICPQDNTS